MTVFFSLKVCLNAARNRAVFLVVCILAGEIVLSVRLAL